MTTITELANTINGYLNNTTIVREQRRRYDAEAECDNEIIRRQNAEGVEQIVIADLYQLQTNTRNQVNRMLNNITGKRTRIGIPQPFFDWDDSIPDFLAKLRLYLQNQGVDPADNAGAPPTGREVAIGYLRGCMRGKALEWFDEEITTKQNWELANLLDNTGQANLVAVNGRNAGQIGNQALNEAFGQPGTAIVKLRAVEGPWDEDWRIAGSRPANIAVNALNANNGTTVVVAGIRFGQAIWWLKTHFPTVEEELRDLMYGTIRKGNMTIDELYRKLLRIGRRANYRPEELRRKFLDALPLPWLEKAEDIGEHLPLDELAKKLYEIELRRIARHKRDRLPDPLRNNNSARIDRMEEGLEETRNNVNQLADLFQKQAYIRKCGICGETGHSKGSCPKRPIAQSNFTRSYFTPLKPIVPPDSDGEENDGDGYDEENNMWTGYDPPGNSKHITDSLGWYTDVPVTLKDKENKTVTVIGNFVRIDNGETEPMLFFGMSNIRKQGSSSQGFAKREAGPIIWRGSNTWGPPILADGIIADPSKTTLSDPAEISAIG
ncbi:hypothetical protein RhiirB3_432866 [Rhizophagus irregularis]|nr:hypothetical protein RhiirB3_432866 [Rhizophagus irregularis]